MKRSILNIIISFLLIFQFSLGNLAILSNISKANEIYSIESCNEAEEGRGCQTIKFWIFERCFCPPQPREKTDL